MIIVSSSTEYITLILSNSVANAKKSKLEITFLCHIIVLLTIRVPEIILFAVKISVRYRRSILCHEQEKTYTNERMDAGKGGISKSIQHPGKLYMDIYTPDPIVM